MPESTPFAKAYITLFGTVEVTQAQVHYHYLVDNYRNVMVFQQQLQSTLAYLGEARSKALLDTIPPKEISALEAGAAAAEELGLAKGKAAAQQRFLQDVEKVYADIKDFDLYNKRMQPKANQTPPEKPAQIAEAQKPSATQKPKEIATKRQNHAKNFNVAGVLGAAAFYVGADVTANIAESYVYAKDKIEQLNLPEVENRKYQQLVAHVEVKVIAAQKLAQGHLRIPNVENFFGSAVDYYDDWATRNHLSERDRVLLNPVTWGIERAKHAMEIQKAPER